MAEDEDMRDEKFDFTAEGEVLGYISLDQARVQAIEHARNRPGIGLVWEVYTAHERDDYYDIRLSFRPSRSFRGEPGVEQFVFEKNGDLRMRQILDEPSAIESPKRWRLSLIARLAVIIVVGGVAAIGGFAIIDSDETLTPPSISAPSTPVPIAVEKVIINHVPLVEEVVAEKDSGQHPTLPIWVR